MTKRSNTRPQAEQPADTLAAQRERAARLRDAAGRAAVTTPAPPTEREQAAAEWRVLAGEGIHHGDGTVSYSSADGAVVRRPIASWVAFVAAQMHHRVQEETARQLNDPDLSDAARAALAAELRRTLRSDAVSDLAFRADRVLSRAQADEGAEAQPPRAHQAGAISRDLRAAIEAHRSARQLLIRDPVRDEARRAAALARLDVLASAVRAAPVRTSADLRWKMIYLWPGNLEEAGAPDGLAEIFGAFREDALRLGGEDPAADHDDLAPQSDGDPIFAAIEECRRLLAVDGEVGTPDAARALSEHIDDVLLQTVPTTAGGCVALARFATEFQATHGGALEQVEGLTLSLIARSPLLCAGPIAPPAAAPLSVSDLIFAAIDPPAGDIVTPQSHRGLTDPDALTASLLDGWAAWGATLPQIVTGDEYVPAYDRAMDRRLELLNAAEALPATPQAIIPKALALAWVEFVGEHRPKLTRAEHSFTGRLGLDIHAAIMGRPAPAAKPADPQASGPDLTGMFDYGAATLTELLYLRELADLVSSTAYALGWSGRGTGGYRSGNLTPVGRFMVELGDALTDVESAAEREARRRQPADPDERETRLAVFADAVIRNDDSDELAAFAAELVAHAAALREGH